MCGWAAAWQPIETPNGSCLWRPVIQNNLNGGDEAEVLQEQKRVTHRANELKDTGEASWRIVYLLLPLHEVK
jgi:hypothetical protein